MSSMPPLAGPHLGPDAPAHAGLLDRTLSIRLRYRYGALLVMFLLTILIGPPLAQADPGRIPVNMLTVAQIGVVAWTVSRTRRLRILMAVLVPLAMALSLAQALRRGEPVALVAEVLDALVIAVALVQILHWTIRQSQATLDTVLACICAYLLIGLWFAYVYSMTETLWRGSFLDHGRLLHDLGGPERPMHRYLDLLYFSFTTLTTLGFGDVLPMRPVARSLAMVEALIGQAYMATFVSFIVGIYISDQARQRETRLRAEIAAQAADDRAS